MSRLIVVNGRDSQPCWTGGHVVNQLAVEDAEM